MSYKNVLLNPFILASLVAGVFENLSSGLIIAGLTVLIWGYRRGMYFIALTTTILVLLTGNINMEIIFLYSLTLAVLINEGNLLPLFDRNVTFLIFGILSIILFPFWKIVLGLIPAQLLNQFNIAGIILIISGLLINFLRGRKIIAEGGNIYKFIVIYMVSTISLTGSWYAILIVMASMFFIEYQDQYSLKLSNRPSFVLNLLLVVVTVFSAYFILPGNLLAIVGVMMIPTYFFWKKEVIPLMELVYMAYILGIVAGKLGLLS